MKAAGQTVDQEAALSLERAHATAEQLLTVIRAETEALKGFQKERLLALLVEKEALACELTERMKSLQIAARSPGTRQGPSPDSKAPADTVAESREGLGKRASLRNLLDEIARCNRRNHVFVQGSLNLWRELLAVCLPTTYVFDHTGEAARQSVPTKGFTLNREI